MVWTLRRVDLSGNQLHCDCAMFAFKDIGTAIDLAHAQCATPLPFAGEFLAQINSDDYECARNATMGKCARACSRVHRDALVSDSSRELPPVHVYIGLLLVVYVYTIQLSISSSIESIFDIVMQLIESIPGQLHYPDD